jgi:DNA repair protein RecO (recombination protein O)
MTPSSRHHKSLALTLRVIDFSETSQVVHLYARELGRVHAIAKGSKRKKSAFRGGFDVVTLVEILRIEKEPVTLEVKSTLPAPPDNAVKPLLLNATPFGGAA